MRPIAASKFRNEPLIKDVGPPLEKELYKNIHSLSLVVWLRAFSSRLSLPLLYSIMLLDLLFHDGLVEERLWDSRRRKNFYCTGSEEMIIVLLLQLPSGSLILPLLF